MCTTAIHQRWPVSRHADFPVAEDGKPVGQLQIDLKYGPRGAKVIRHVKRVSKPGCRVYSGSRDLRPVLNGMGITIISSSRGGMSDREARQRNLGGEVLGEVW